MSEQSPESPTTEVTVEADQAVVNNAPDGGGVDNNEAPAEADSSASEGDSAE